MSTNNINQILDDTLTVNQQQQRGRLFVKTKPKEFQQTSSLYTHTHIHREGRENKQTFFQRGSKLISFIFGRRRKHIHDITKQQNQTTIREEIRKEK